MIQIRKGVFETNSSSTHSICISKAIPRFIPEHINFTPGEYGWENSTVGDTASYLYTGIMDGPEELVEPRLERLKELLDELGVTYRFYEPKKDKYGFLDGCYIDHAWELGEFIDWVLTDKDRLARLLFGDSFINTGNDNQDSVPGGCDIGEPYYWSFSGNQERKLENPYHDPEHYDYFVKGN